MSKNKEVEFDLNFSRVSKELKKYCDNFLIKGVPPEYKGIWLPKKEIRSWAIPERSGHILKMLVLARKPKVTLELGTSFGYSTLWLAYGARQTKGKVYTVELTTPKIEGAKKYFKKAGLDKSIVQIQGLVSSVLNQWDRKIDFVFMDADKKNYLQYIKKIEPHLSSGAIIIADNATDYGYLMKDYLNYVSNSGRFHSYLLNIDNGLMISVKK